MDKELIDLKLDKRHFSVVSLVIYGPNQKDATYRSVKKDKLWN
jgi:hypothetical protein